MLISLIHYIYIRMSTKLWYDIAAEVTGKENEEDLKFSSRRDSVNEENTSMNKPGQKSLWRRKK